MVKPKYRVKCTFPDAGKIERQSFMPQRNTRTVAGTNILDNPNWVVTLTSLWIVAMVVTSFMISVATLTIRAAAMTNSESAGHRKNDTDD